jgi:hypothetical protein
MAGSSNKLVGGCKAWTVQCGWYEIAGRNMPPCCRQKVYELAEWFSEELTKEGIAYFPAWGSLIDTPKRWRGF